MNPLNNEAYNFESSYVKAKDFSSPGALSKESESDGDDSTRPEKSATRVFLSGESPSYRTAIGAKGV